MNQKQLLCIILLFTVAIYAYAQPRVAVIPFSAKNTSDFEAEAITSVFETALVNLDKYSVIEQIQIGEILNAQAYSLSGCTDDSCAVEVGELLSAEQIILGSLTKIGTKYLLTAKLIDVETGEHLKADDVQSNSIDDMLDQARALAYSISGMAYQYQPKAGEDISYGEIYITTTPYEAEIYINGKKAGVSPYLFSNIPVGKTIIEARKGNYYSSEEIQITGQLLEYSMTLLEITGTVFIESTVTDVKVVLDGFSLGQLQDGLFKDVSIGNHTLELKNISKGYYWKDEIEIVPNKTIRIRAEPYGIGTFLYSIPSDIKVEIYSKDFERAVLTGENSLSLREGVYFIESSGEIYESDIREIRIGRNAEVHYVPKLEYSVEYKRSLQIDKWNKDISKFSRWIESPESFNKTIDENDKMALESLYAEIETSKYSEASLLSDIEELLPKYANEIKENKINKLAEKIDELYAEKSMIESANSIIDIVSWSGIGVGIASTALFITGMILSELAYTDYQNAVYSYDLVETRETVQLWDKINLISGITAASTAAIGVGTAFIEIDTTALNAEIAKTSMELATQNGGVNSK